MLLIHIIIYPQSEIMSSKNQKNSDWSKKPRKVITLEQKLDVLKRYENNERTCDIARDTGLNEATLRTIRANAEKIKVSCASATPLGASRSSHARITIMQTMERMLVTWIEDQVKNNSLTSIMAIKVKALSLFDDLKKDYPEEMKNNFTASNGWFSRFKARQQLDNIWLMGEAAGSLKRDRSKEMETKFMAKNDWFSRFKAHQQFDNTWLMGEAADSLKENYPEKMEMKFPASNVFKTRHKLQNIRLTGEAAGSDSVAAEQFPEILKLIVEEGGYTSKQVFNVDETGLFWKRLPTRTYISRDEQMEPGFKAAKDHVTVMLGGNANGDKKLKPVVIYHSENPRALKDFLKSSLPVYWRWTQTGCISGPIFNEWFIGQLHDELEEYCKAENIDFNILLLLDNASGHPPIVQTLSTHIKVVFLPHSMTELFQPMDQGVISIFKAYYLQKTFVKLVEETGGKNKLTVKEFWRYFNIKHAFNIIAGAWNEVSQSCMNSVWEKLLPQFVLFRDFVLDDAMKNVHQQCIQLAREIGFNEVEEGDVVELLESHKEQLSNEELTQLHEELGFLDEDQQAEDLEKEETLQELTEDILMKNINKIEEALNELSKFDCQLERSSKITKGVKSVLCPYYELLREKRKAATQPRRDIFKKLKNSEETFSVRTSDKELQSASKKI